MKPPPFSYRAPTTVEAAQALLAEHSDEEARVLAGGQSLIPLMNFRLAQPTHLVDLGHLPSLDVIRHDDGALAVGAMVRQSALEHSAETARTAPLLVEATRLVAHPPIRHRGTVGGSIAHADPAAELPAAVLALDGEMVATSVRGRRAIPASEFFLGPFTTALQPDEILTELRVPSWPAGAGYAFEEFTRTHGNFAVVGAAALVQLDGERVAGAALALCGVGGTPLRAHEAERTLTGEEPSADAIRSAADAAVAGLEPTSEVHASGPYRLRLTRAYARRALELASERALGER
ncbi:MAG: FAD binding domain-containing protein [Nocardioidaceae bacterium]